MDQLDFAQQLEKIKNTTSTKAKEALLLDYLSSSTQEVLYAIFDLANNYNLKTYLTDFKVIEKVTGRRLSSHCQEDLKGSTTGTENFLSIYNDVKGGVKYLRDDWLKALTVLAHSSTPGQFYWYEKAICKDLVCGASLKIFNKACKQAGLKEIPEFKCMKVSSLKDARITYPAYVSEKKDGVNLVCIKEKDEWEFYTRNGSSVFLPHIKKSLEVLEQLYYDELVTFKTDNWVIFGELVSSTRQDSGGLVNSAIKSREKSDLPIEDLTMHIFDILPRDEYLSGNFVTVFKDRLAVLDVFKDVVLTNYQGITFIEHTLVSSEQGVYDSYNLFRAQDSEGVIINDAEGLYEFGRSKKRARIKAVNEGEFEIYKFKVHSKNPNWLGSLEIRTKDGLIKSSLGSGFSDSLRKQYWQQRHSLIGKIVTAKFNSIIPDSAEEKGYTMFLPVFKELRDDKNIADTYATVIKNSKL